MACQARESSPESSGHEEAFRSHEEVVPEMDRKSRLCGFVLSPSRAGMRRSVPELGCAVGSWGGSCLSMAPYVTGMGSTDWATAPPEGAHVGYLVCGKSAGRSLPRRPWIDLPADKALRGWPVAGQNAWRAHGNHHG